MSSRKEWALIVSLLLGAILVPINSTMIAVALSSISHTYNESIASITWVVTVYLIVMAVTQPIAGKLGDMYGNKTMYLWGVGLFLIASLGCALSPSLLLLIVFRALQAVGGALLTPNSIAIIRHVVSEKRLPKVFGFFGLGAGDHLYHFLCLYLERLSICHFLFTRSKGSDINSSHGRFFRRKRKQPSFSCRSGTYGNAADGCSVFGAAKILYCRPVFRSGKGLTLKGEAI